MRARLAIASSGITVELREILLRDKAPEFLSASPKGTVPVLIADEVVEESRDIMLWALGHSDPEGLLDPKLAASHDLIDCCDGPFKTALDLTKYAVRHPEADPDESRTTAAKFIKQLNLQLDGAPWLFGNRPNIADFAILPFVRQFAHTDVSWWDSQPYPYAKAWLASFKESARFASIMTKYSPWKAGDDVIQFP